MRFHPYGRSEKNAIGLIKTVEVTGFGPSSITSVRHIGRHLILKLNSVRDIETAQSLVNRNVSTHTKNLPPALDGDAYIGTLLNLQVMFEGKLLGKVTRVNSVGLNLLIEVATKHGNILLPFSAPYIHLGENHIEVNNPPIGLLGPL